MRMTGKNGKITLASGDVLDIQDWSIDAKIPTTDATVMGDQFHVKLSLIREWSFSADFVWDNAAGNNTLFTSLFAAATTDGGPQSGKGSFQFFPDKAGTEKWAGDAFVDFSLKVPVGGEIKGTMKGTGTGSLTYTAPS